MKLPPTPYPEVNEILSLLQTKASDILGDQFVGMYLYGSLSSGDFDLKASDIDFLFVTEGTLSDEQITDLKSMHQQIWNTGLYYVNKLEGAYVPKSLIRRHDPNGTSCPTINEGKFYIAPLGSDWIIQRHVVREHGVVIKGPAPDTLIDFVTPEEIRSAIKGILNEWWFPMLEDPTWLKEHDHQYRSFAVITMCRVLHGLEHGIIVSKPKATTWAIETLGNEWKPLIELSIAVRNHAEVDVPLEETLKFIKFFKERTL